MFYSPYLLKTEKYLFTHLRDLHIFKGNTLKPRETKTEIKMLLTQSDARQR